MENLLRNIKPTDTVYRVISENIVESLRKVFGTAPWIQRPDANKIANMDEVKIIGTDSYFLHYSYLPQLEPADKFMDNKILKTAHKVFSYYINTEEYQNIKQITTLDDELSKIYAIDLTRRVSEAIRKELENSLRKMNNKELNSLAQQLASMGLLQLPTAVGQGQQQGQESSSKGRSSNADRLMSDIYNALIDNIEKQEAQQIIRDLINENANTKVMEMELSKALREAGKTAEKTKKIAKFLAGGMWAGKSISVYEKAYKIAVKSVNNVEKIISLADQITKNMPKFTKIVKKRGKFGDRVIGYYKTRNVRRAIPRDLALPEPLFTTKLVNGFTAREKAVIGEGAYYVLIDKSGSMDGEPTAWARSMALALLQLAKKKGRKYFLRFFDVKVYDLKTDYEEIFDEILYVRSGGGTSITRALRTAVEDIKKHGLGEKTNTIIIITDGLDDVDERLVWEFKKNNVRLVAVMIDEDNETLKKIAETTGGQYMHVVPDKKNALKIIEASSR